MNKRGSEAEAGAAETSAETGETAAETGGGRKGRRMRGRGVEEEAELQEQARPRPSLTHVPLPPPFRRPPIPFRPRCAPCLGATPPEGSGAPVPGVCAGRWG